ncbi:hypothetical protein A6E12_12560 [Aliivibrio fischeri]|uniref:TIGR04255 family protein n=1 Tax=Aliivibrio fischeri TaxID=668 RepID=UPI00080D9EFA|nr:TIGR04255 family protein [Aliivibrio fischeri]OCH26607.1 hypothetical protein A6E12_12560 [Aliivibrio fischeri]
MFTKGYQHAPLLMTLVDIRFSSIPDFYESEKLVQLESLFRDIGFVEKVIEKQQEMSFELKSDADGKIVHSAKPTVNQHEKQRWIFLNLDRTLSVYVAQDGISIKSTKYICHEEYVQSISKILSKLVQVFSSLLKGVTARIGTRYLNLIIPLEGKDVANYLKPEWLPNNSIPTEVDVEFGVHNRLMMNYKTKYGALRVESNKFTPEPNASLSIIPNELQDSPETALSIQELPWWGEQINRKVSYVILDIDLSNPIRIMFDIEGIVDLLNKMRKLTRPAFNMCITEEAKQDWIEI